MIDDAAQLLDELACHRIEGIAAHGSTPVSAPLLTQIDETLWQGGCVQGVDLGGYFQHIVSLYSGERFNPGCDLASFVEVRLFDESRVPNPEMLYHLARWVNLCRARGRVLVHCQAGLNRSALVTGLALVLAGLTPTEAITTLRKRSPAILCNKYFERWLLSQGGSNAQS